MKTKSVPAIVMLSAGFVACVAGICAHMEVADFMKMLLIVLIVFYLLGGVVKIVLDRNFAGMNDEETTDGTLPQEEEDPEAEENETASEETENACAERKADYGICTACESGCGPAQHVSWIQCGIRRSG